MNGFKIIISNYKTIQISKQQGVLLLKFNRPEANNSINSTLIKEIIEVFTEVKENTTIKVIVLEGNTKHFCTGMDFQAVSEENKDALIGNGPNDYYNMLNHITFCSKVVVAKVDGKVNAGGVGIVAASDIVIASDQSTFGLSEALFGLLPACVMPFLIKRIGVQKAQWMTFTTQGISAKRAYEIGLVDELSLNTQDTLRRNLLRLTRLETSTILKLNGFDK